MSSRNSPIMMGSVALKSAGRRVETAAAERTGGCQGSSAGGQPAPAPWPPVARAHCAAAAPHRPLQLLLSLISHPASGWHARGLLTKNFAGLGVSGQRQEHVGQDCECGGLQGCGQLPAAGTGEGWVSGWGWLPGWVRCIVRHQLVHGHALGGCLWLGGLRQHQHRPAGWASRGRRKGARLGHAHSLHDVQFIMRAATSRMDQRPSSCQRITWGEDVDVLWCVVCRDQRTNAKTVYDRTSSSARRAPAFDPPP